MSRKFSLVAALTVILMLSFASFAFAAQNVEFNGSGNGVNDFAPTPTRDASGNPIFNADGKTNYPNEIYLPNEQSPTSYRIHSNYAATTDACASCHATHTAVGESLLQWGTVYDTCMACHDGSVSSTYDVQNGEIGSTKKAAFGGAFGTIDDQMNHSGSNHNVTGSMDIYAAPGGPGTADLAAAENKEVVHGEPGKQVSWDVEFGCQSCHSPHGQGGNARILNADVNGVAWAEYNKGDNTANGGSQNVTLKVLDAAANTYYSDYNKDGVKDTWIIGYPYSNEVKVNGTVVYPTIDNKAGFTTITFASAPAATPVASFQPALVVKMNVANYLGQGGDESVTHVSGLNSFCGACHTDYNTAAAVTGSGSKLTGQYTEAYRHQVGFFAGYFKGLAGANMKLESNNMTCETCHVAHGTNETYWSKTLPATLQDKEIAGSSALKRVANMGTCEACHEKGKGNEGYAVNNGGTPIATPVAAATDPSAGGGFVGQAACASCHGDLHKEYNKTWHPEMSRPGLSPETLADIQKPENAAKINTLLPFFIAEAVKANAETAKVGYDEKGAVKLEPAAWAGKGVIADNIKIWTTGTEYGQEIMARGDLVGAPAGKEKNWYIVLYKQGTAYTPVAPVDANGAVTPAGLLSDEYACANSGCHTTGVNVNGGYQGNNVSLASSAAYTTGWLEKVAAGQKPDFELGITCEACHGQGGNHVKAPSSKNIVNPATYTLAQQSTGTKSTFDAVNNKWTAASDRFLNTAAGAKSCGLCHSGKHQGDFFSTQTYNDFDGVSTGIKVNPSKMYLNDAVSCVTCHDSHSDAVKGQLNAPTGEKLCESCHGAGAIDLSKAMPAYPRSTVLHRHDFAVKK